MAILNEQQVIAIPRPIPVVRRLSDKFFRAILIFGGLFAFVVLAGIFSYLFSTARPVLELMGFDFLFTSTWYTGDGLLPSQGSIDPPRFGIAAMIWGSLLISVVALVIAVPLAVGVSLAITQVLPKRIAFWVTSLVDLVAAVPSVVFGLWGAYILSPHAQLWAAWLNRNLGDTIPVFSVNFEYFGQSPFMAGLVLAIMITPIITAVSREIFSQVPHELVTGAQALGASRWSVVRDVVIPFGRSGVIGGAMLGLGRALGETIAVFFVLQVFTSEVNWYRILESQGGSVATLIVSRFGEAGPTEVSALFGAGLALFLVTLAANAAASVIVKNVKSGVS